MKKKFYILSFLLFTVLCLNIALSQIKSAAFETVASHVIRLHIIANSDTKTDQERKLKVRDAIITYMKDQAIDLKNVEETREFLQSHKSTFCDIAKKVLEKSGSHDLVTASLTKCHFPDKKYGNTIFPEGTYEAFRIEIGNASGHNWWCVLYPPLCFLDESTEIMTEDSSSCTESSDSFDTSKDSYEIRFKLLDFLFQK